MYEGTYSKKFVELFIQIKSSCFMLVLKGGT